jgi:hypothetical protein
MLLKQEMLTLEGDVSYTVLESLFAARKLCPRC